jgi:multisubunit Na+/H+ antiporter MnhF subunit
MNPWLLAGCAVVLSGIPAGVQVFRSDAMDRLCGLELMGILVPMALLLLAHAFQRTAYLDLAVAAALLAFGAGLVFTRFLERWL